MMQKMPEALDLHIVPNHNISYQGVRAYLSRHPDSRPKSLDDLKTGTALVRMDGNSRLYIEVVGKREGRKTKVEEAEGRSRVTHHLGEIVLELDGKRGFLSLQDARQWREENIGGYHIIRNKPLQRAVKEIYGLAKQRYEILERLLGVRARLSF